SRGLESFRVGLCPRPFVAMDLPDDSQWDETTCDLALCQHPQCWATVRRIERGHPRILSSPCKTLQPDEDKLPELTIVNMSDSCFFSRHLSKFTFSKARSLLCRGSKSKSKFQGRPQKGLPVKSWINSTNKPSKLSVLNLNDTPLPCSEDVSNMVVIWVPEESEKSVSQHRKNKVKTWAGKKGSSPSFSRKQYPETQSRMLKMIVPPPTPVPLSEQLASDCIPSWDPFHVLPQDLLEELLSDEGKTMLSPEMKIQLAMMKKSLPLEKNRPDSAISSKMFLSVHRLTLQRPALRYPEFSKKLRCNLKTEEWQQEQQRQQEQQQQQQRRVQTPTKEAKNKARNGPGIQGTSNKRLSTIAYDPLFGLRTLRGQKSHMKQQQVRGRSHLGTENSTERSKMDYSKKCVDFSLSMESLGSPERELTNKNISAPVKATLEPQASRSEDSWNPELKLLRILQATDDEDDDDDDEDED
uniref:Chromosome 9 open reading frame 43 n=1 Tax=Otolemur garnettii TaxID=30611 RepID=H0X3K2_OTOGA